MQINDLTAQIAFEVERLLNYALQKQLIISRDIIYLRNQYYSLLNIFNEVKLNHITEILEFPDTILDQLFAYIIKSPDLSEKLGDNEDLVKCNLMQYLIPRPSIVEDKFKQIQINSSIQAALLYFYQLSMASNYIKVRDLNKNLHWQTQTDYGKLEITVNLAKPEKDPHEIAKLKQQTTNISYPKCQLCIENEGFSGHDNQASRYTHRLITLSLNNQEWFFQFSPYSYYNEHAIIINKQHQDMRINQDTFITLFDFVDLVPDYFIGSNADLPIVGGSILNHDHFQGGKHIFPMDLAKVRQTINWQQFSKVEGQILDWPLSVIRLIGSRQDLIQLSTHILNCWRNYSDETVDILAKTTDMHNSLTVIVRKLDSSKDQYSINLILRNNRKTSKFSYGIFHPHIDLHHIKKENIGLIEAMGLAILPGRLNQELKLIIDLLNKDDAIKLINNITENNPLAKHKSWLFELKTKLINQEINQELLEYQVGLKFLEVLNCCGVFKNDAKGHLAFK